MGLSHLNAWRAVEAVFRLGSVARAASDLNVTKAAVAAQIRTIEEYLGHPLFERTPAGLQPVAGLSGQGDRLSAAFVTLADVQRALSDMGPGNRVSVSVSQTFAEVWLPRHLSDLFSRMGQIDLNLKTTWDLADLRDPDLHFAIRYMGEPSEDIEALWLFPSGVVPVCTPEFASRYDLSETETDISRVPLVHVDVPTTDPDWADWEMWSRATGMKTAAGQSDGPSYKFTGSGLRLAQSGVGLVLGGLSEVFAALETGALIMPFGKKSVIPGRYAHKLIWKSGRRFGPVQRDFRNWIGEKAKADHQVMTRVFGL